MFHPEGWISPFHHLLYTLMQMLAFPSYGYQPFIATTNHSEMQWTLQSLASIVAMVGVKQSWKGLKSCSKMADTNLRQNCSFYTRVYIYCCLWKASLREFYNLMVHMRKTTLLMFLLILLLLRLLSMLNLLVNSLKIVILEWLTTWKRIVIS